jgi:hypothetical protein
LYRICCFIDESGVPIPDQSTFVAAAVICAPLNGINKEKILEFTHRGIVDSLEANRNKKINELHFSDGLKGEAKAIVEAMLSKSYDDRSIKKTGAPWKKHHLKMNSIVTMPKVEYFGSIKRPDIGNYLRGRVVSSLLRPFLNYRGDMGLEIDVILDGIIWKPAIVQSEGNFQNMIEGIPINFNFSYINCVE